MTEATNSVDQLAEQEKALEEFTEEYLPADTTDISGRECRKITLPKSKQNVFMVDEWNQGEQEDFAVQAGKLETGEGEEAMQAFRDYVRFRVNAAIKKIEDKEGKEVEYTVDWYRGLSKTDASVVLKYINLYLGKE